MIKKYLTYTIVAILISASACNSNSSSENATEETAIEDTNAAVITALDTWLDNVESMGDLEETKILSLEAEFMAETAKIDATTLSDEDKKAFDDVVERWNLVKRFNVAEGAPTEELLVD